MLLRQFVVATALVAAMAASGEGSASAATTAVKTTVVAEGGTSNTCGPGGPGTCPTFYELEGDALGPSPVSIGEPNPFSLIITTGSDPYCSVTLSDTAGDVVQADGTGNATGCAPPSALQSAHITLSIFGGTGPYAGLVGHDLILTGTFVNAIGSVTALVGSLASS